MNRIIARAAAATPKPVLLLGAPELRAVCRPVGADALLEAEKGDLVCTLEEFRRINGFGRGIAAPQIGVTRRFIALNLGDGPVVLNDPEIIWRSEETMTLWDDCMSFPWLMCRVERHCSISVGFTTEDGEQQVWEHLPPATSELLAHELDHLDGVLSLDRATDGMHSIISRDVFESNKDEFVKQVDYFIKPTILD
jgi:peptide deformylase